MSFFNVYGKGWRNNKIERLHKYSNNFLFSLDINDMIEEKNVKNIINDKIVDASKHCRNIEDVYPVLGLEMMLVVSVKSITSDLY